MALEPRIWIHLLNCVQIKRHMDLPIPNSDIVSFRAESRQRDSRRRLGLRAAGGESPNSFTTSDLMRIESQWETFYVEFDLVRMDIELCFNHSQRPLRLSANSNFASIPQRNQNKCDCFGAEALPAEADLFLCAFFALNFDQTMGNLSNNWQAHSVGERVAPVHAPLASD